MPSEFASVSPLVFSFFLFVNFNVDLISFLLPKSMINVRKFKSYIQRNWIIKSSKIFF